MKGLLTYDLTKNRSCFKLILLILYYNEEYKKKVNPWAHLFKDIRFLSKLIINSKREHLLSVFGYYVIVLT
jgi:hypothetical protein